uniref:Hemolysin activation/secretion protein n=1 Tax=Candidatus Kentrum sp. FW TaxID=2126338 RepID=A0A450STB2_9GAMM|nr:MAG: Hemolysin activation/secretion protein [Candidatus Kentron sp. FW]
MKARPMSFFQLIMLSVPIFGLNTTIYAQQTSSTSIDTVLPECSAPVKPKASSDSIQVIPKRKCRVLPEYEGAGIAVSTFRLDGVNEYPDFAINVSEIEKLVEDFRMQRMDEKGRLTFPDLKDAADIVTNYYKERDFFVAKASVPHQNVNDGVVIMKVLERRFGGIIVKPSTSGYTAAQFEPLFDLEPGQPIVGSAADIHKGILIANDYPGVQLAGSLKPSKTTPGDMDIHIEVQQEERWDGSIAFDNHGYGQIQQDRVSMNLGFNNMMGLADRLDLSLLKGFSIQDENLFGSVKYSFPILDGMTRLGGSYSENTYFTSALADFNIHSTNEIGQVYIERDFIRSPMRKLSGFLAFNYKDSYSEVFTDGRTYRDTLFVMDLMTDAELRDQVMVRKDLAEQNFAAVNQFSFGYHHGFEDVFESLDNNDPNSTRLGGSGEKAGGKFDKVTATYRRYHPLSENIMLMLQAEGQWSNDLLTSAEQQTLGGPYNVRAYRPGEFLMDKGYFGSAEISMDLPKLFDNQLNTRISAFVDYARGWLNDPLPNQKDTVSLAAMGLGLELNIWGINWRTQAASPLDTGERSSGENPRIFTELRWDF